MLVPTGFWSYTTSDEVNSRGKLSQLRALLAAELQQQVGRMPKVNIFQDVAAIPPGAEWERQIQTAIAESSFLIPVVTPAFLQSEWCCHEVDLFRRREDGLGVRELVFPIHYVDTDDLGGAEACHDPAVLAFLRTRQWTDFRSLRFRPQEGEDVSLVLERLARGILAALRRADRPASAPGLAEPDASREATPGEGIRLSEAPATVAASTVTVAPGTPSATAEAPVRSPAAGAATGTKTPAGTPAKTPAKPKTLGEVIGNGVISTLVGTFLAGLFATGGIKIVDVLFGADIGFQPVMVIAILAFVVLTVFFVVDGAKDLRRMS